MLGICAPVKVGARKGGCGASTFFFLRIFASELEITGSGVIGALSRGTERGSERRALPRTAGSLAASRYLGGVVRVAAGDVARVVGVCERVVKEVHRGDGCGVSWKLLFLVMQNSVKIYLN